MVLQVRVKNNVQEDIKSSKKKFKARGRFTIFGYTHYLVLSVAKVTVGVPMYFLREILPSLLEPIVLSSILKLNNRSLRILSDAWERWVVNSFHHR